jgi:asparagine synthase (glutamine-hydrolysing)
VGQFIEWLKAADRPSIDGFNTYIVSGAVKDSGITVALSGLGADEIFGGYGIFARATRLKRLMQPLAWVSRRLRRAAAGVVFSVLPPLRRAKAVEMVAHGDSPADLAIWSRRLLLDDQLAALGLHAGSLGLTDHYLPPEACRAFEAVGDPFHDVSQAEISLYMGNTLLRDSDVNSMAHSLELRVPFLGRQLIDYVCSLPAAVRAPPRSQPKYLLRAAMRDCLPLEIFSRPKTGFTLPVDEWLDGELRGLCEAAVEQLATCSIVEPAAVRSLWNNFQGKRTPGLLSRRMALVALGHYVRSVSLL